MKVKFEIKHYITGAVLFEFESSNNDLKNTLETAVDRGANLRGANLYGANLYGADLRGANLRGANLYGANLYGANLYGANLYGADLRGADLRGANLRGANLYGANLRGANLYGANLYGADLRGANLYGANLYGANLYGANLRGANLYGANLRGANLYGAKNAALAASQTVVAAEGAIIGWKVARLNDSSGTKVIVKLLIPEDAKRSNATGRKCRASSAEVLGIYPKNRKRAMAKVTVVRSDHDSSFTYKTGDILIPTTEFDENRWEECSTGIHFFITRDEAEDY